MLSKYLPMKLKRMEIQSKHNYSNTQKYVLDSNYKQTANSKKYTSLETSVLYM